MNYYVLKSMTVWVEGEGNEKRRIIKTLVDFPKFVNGTPRTFKIGVGDSLIGGDKVRNEKGGFITKDAQIKESKESEWKGSTAVGCTSKKFSIRGWHVKTERVTGTSHEL